MPKIPMHTPAEARRAAERLGFFYDRKSGSHDIYKHLETGAVIPIPEHPGDLNIDTLRGALHRAGVSVRDYIAALKKKR